MLSILKPYGSWKPELEKLKNQQLHALLDQNERIRTIYNAYQLCGPVPHPLYPRTNRLQWIHAGEECWECTTCTKLLTNDGDFCVLSGFPGQLNHRPAFSAGFFRSFIVLTVIYVSDGPNGLNMNIKLLL